MKLSRRKHYRERITVTSSLFEISTLSEVKQNGGEGEAAICPPHRFNMELDLQSLIELELHVHCAHLYSLAETPQPPLTPAFRLLYEGAIGQLR